MVEELRYSTRSAAQSGKDYAVTTPVVFNDDGTLERALGDEIDSRASGFVNEVSRRYVCGRWIKHCFNDASVDVGEVKGSILGAAWWLNGPKRVSLSTCFEVRCHNGFVDYRNVDTHLIWYDEIDARSFEEFDNAQKVLDADQTPNYRNKWIEGSLDKLEQPLGLGYDIEIHLRRFDPKVVSTNFPCDNEELPPID